MMRELIDSCRIAGKVPEAAVMIDGDPTPYKGIRWPANWTVHVADEHLEMIGATNELVRRHPDKPWYGFLNDRARPITDDWWEKLVDACKGGWANCKSLGTNPRTGKVRMKDGIYDGAVVRALGWFFPPFLTHFYGDDVLEEVLQDNGLWRQTDVEIEERAVPKLPRIHRGRAYWDDDRIAYEGWKASHGMQQLTAKLREAGLC